MKKILLLSFFIPIILACSSVSTFSFNKIETVAISSSNYINLGDSIDLMVIMAAFDSTENIKIRYWEDDTSYISPGNPYKPYSKVIHADRDLTNMKTFTGAIGERLKFTGGVGDHIVVGEIAVKEKGVEKWKPWKYKYTVGVPFGLIQAVETQVLYKDWDNKIFISAQGYNHEKISVQCYGCSMSYKPDKDGNYIVNVTRGDEAFVTLSVTDDFGKKIDLCKQRFRILDKGESPIDF